MAQTRCVESKRRFLLMHSVPIHTQLSPDPKQTHVRVAGCLLPTLASILSSSLVIWVCRRMVFCSFAPASSAAAQEASCNHFMLLPKHAVLTCCVKLWLSQHAMLFRHAAQHAVMNERLSWMNTCLRCSNESNLMESKQKVQYCSWCIKMWAQDRSARSGNPLCRRRARTTV